MPELPDVEAFRKYADKRIKNKKIKNTEINDRKVVTGSAAGFEKLKGKKIIKTSRRGKYMFVHTDKDPVILMHFGMTGYLRVVKNKDDIPKSTRVTFDLDSDERLCFICRRKLGRIGVTMDLDQYLKDKGLGPDAMEVSKKEFIEKLSNKKGMVKPALIDQHVISGIGNIYADEILFHAEVHPKMPIQKMNEDQIGELYTIMKNVFKTAIRHNAQPDELPDNYLLRHRKDGEKCPKGKGKIKKMTVGGRSTYICADLQKE